MSPRIALVTCSQLPDLAEDEPLLREELERRGHVAEPAVWDDPEVDWAGYDLAVVRSAWDYAPRRDAFVSWARSVPRLLNPGDVIEWNTDKRYLAGLPHATETTFLEPGDRYELPNDGEFVVKPSISAGSRDAARYTPAEQDRAREHADTLLAGGRTVLIQPYLDAVDAHGETALIFFAGVYSHSIRKGQMLRSGSGPSSDLFTTEEISPREPSAPERSAAEEILDALPWDRHELLYARVDLIPGPDGRPRVLELELTEPSLFLSYAGGAPQRLADCVVDRL